jgi:predicted nucleotidyltransferase
MMIEAKSGKERGRVLKREVDRIVDILRKDSHLQKVVLSGSLVSGKLTPQTDIDLLIIHYSRVG